MRRAPAFAGQGRLCYRCLMRKLLLLLMFLSRFCSCAGTRRTRSSCSSASCRRNGDARDARRDRSSIPAVADRQDACCGSRPAPASTIRTTARIVHAQLPPGAEILYPRDQAGDVMRIYILTEQELAILKQAGRR